MNKNELITFLRNPNDLTESDLGELEEIIKSNPYFLNGRLLLAKGSKELKHPDTRKRITSAAVYSTDRPLFKRYLSDKLFFLSHPPEEEIIEIEVVQEKKSPSENVSKKIEIIDTPKAKVKDVADDKVIQESPKQESPKQESPKQESPKQESPKQESPKQESPKQETPRQEPPKQAEPKKEETKPDKPDNLSENQTQPRREPRFDPSATASFQRRWDVKDESSEDTPKSAESIKSGSIKPANKSIFAGKKIDRSKRVKKKSIRDEIFTEEKPKSKESKPSPSRETKSPTESKNPMPVSKPVERVRKEVPNNREEKKKELPKEATRETIAPVRTKEQVRPSNKDEKAPQKPPVDKEIPITKKDEPKSVAAAPIKRNDLDKQRPTPQAVRTQSNRRLNVPEVPSGGIDALLEELQRDMENLKSSRIKFVEVQQKIEEEDAVSAAVERATKKIPESQPETAIKVEEEEVAVTELEADVEKKEEAQKEEVAEKSDEKEEPKGEDIPPKNIDAKEETAEVETVSKKEDLKTEDPIKEEKTEEKATLSKAKTTLMPKAKKVIPRKKAAAKKETTVKKASAKKTSTAKKASKTTSSKTKSTKKEEKKEDESSGKQKGSQDIIIDKFIAETPSIKYQKKSEPVENVDLSGQSTEWNKELASEYLAEIYLHQGNKKRAIEIYKVLSLKFPDKKSYFADLISKTK